MADKDNVKQTTMLEHIEEWWEKYWKGMPDFKAENLEPYKSIYVHFIKKEDMIKFSKLVGQKVTMETRFIWFPEATIQTIMGKRFVDEESDES